MQQHVEASLPKTQLNAYTVAISNQDQAEMAFNYVHG
jgi:hypothetical protein